MKITEIKSMAKNMGFNPAGMKKSELIRNIQTREGNQACYRMDTDNCDQYNCCWRQDCKPGKF